MEITNVEETVTDILSEKVNFNELEKEVFDTFCEKFDTLESDKKTQIDTAKYDALIAAFWESPSEASTESQIEKNEAEQKANALKALQAKDWKSFMANGGQRTCCCFCKRNKVI